MDDQRFLGDIREIPLGSIAFIGDAVYELAMRSYVMRGRRLKAGTLHHLAVRLVNAGTQAEMYPVLYDLCNEEERNWLQRGRNSNPGTMAKNQDPYAYRLATGVETLFGYLYLTEQDERLNELIQALLKTYEMRQTNGTK